MKIAVTYKDNQIFQHFGHTEAFKMYDIDITDKKIKSSQIIATNGQGHGALAGFLSEHKVEILICGGIGGGAINALSEVGIKIYGGVTGNTDEAVKAFLEGTLNYNPDVKCSHHDHEHSDGHSCGEHKCGEHKFTQINK